MSTLKVLDRECFEELFGMGSGYVMDFSNRTFSRVGRVSPMGVTRHCLDRHGHVGLRCANPTYVWLGNGGHKTR